MNSRTFGLFEPLNQRPYYMNEFFTIYKYARITAATVQLEVVSTSSTPLKMVMVVTPWDEIISPTEAIEKPRSLYRTVGGSSGVSRGFLRRTYHTQQEQGNPVFDKQHWFTAAQSILTTPQDQQGVTVKTLVSTLDGVSNWSAEVSFKVTYHVQFFDLEAPASS